jgi:transposase
MVNRKELPFQPNMLKPQLYEIIKRNKKQHILYRFDMVLQQRGHIALRLPLYHPDLNPIELIWATIKNNVGQKNVTFKLQDAERLAKK